MLGPSGGYLFPDNQLGLSPESAKSVSWNIYACRKTSKNSIIGEYQCLLKTAKFYHTQDSNAADLTNVAAAEYPDPEEVFPSVAAAEVVAVSRRNISVVQQHNDKLLWF